MSVEQEVSPAVDSLLSRFRRLSPSDRQTAYDRITDVIRDEADDEVPSEKKKGSLLDLCGIWVTDDPEEQADIDRMVKVILECRTPPRDIEVDD